MDTEIRAAHNFQVIRQAGIETDLLFAGTAMAYIDVDRPAAPRKAANATGDDIVTDGKMSVVDLELAKVPGAGLQTRQ